MLVTFSQRDCWEPLSPASAISRRCAGRLICQFEKALVAKLKGARARVKAEKGKCEGRKSHAEKRPEVVAEARRLRRASPTNGERRSLRRISRELAAKGYVNERGQPFNPKSVRAMLERK
jgi:hypothetical protein